MDFDIIDFKYRGLYLWSQKMFMQLNITVFIYIAKSHWTTRKFKYTNLLEMHLMYC